MASTTPAAVLGLDNIGVISPQKDVDLVLMDENYQVIWSMIDGELLQIDSVSLN